MRDGRQRSQVCVLCAYKDARESARLVGRIECMYMCVVDNRWRIEICLGMVFRFYMHDGGEGEREKDVVQ